MSPRNAVLRAALKPRVPTEEAEQMALCAWAEAASARVPELGLLLAIPNGGYRSKRTAARMKATGLRAGVPDLFLAAAGQSSYGTSDDAPLGLWIELKRVGAPPSAVGASQREWHEKLKEQGYHVVVARGAREAAAALLGYLGATGKVPLPL